MGYAQVHSVALLGVTGQPVVVEADVTPGLPCLVVSGLPDAALSQARDRVRAAVLNSGEHWPQQRLTVNLLPAHLPKHGTGLDVAIAIGLLVAAGSVPAEPLEDTVILGELGLDGTIRPIRGVLPAVLAAARGSVRQVIVPAANAAEARLVPGLTVHAADCLARLVRFARGKGPLLPARAAAVAPLQAVPDLADVVGQERGHRALTLAAAGRHHLSIIGPPGAGKTMLAQRLPGILPALDDPAALEVTAIHSIAGVLPTQAPLVRRPPFQAPHHSTSQAALVGGGSGWARPGAVSLAHCGVLFLDEAPEVRPGVLDSLRQPLEDGFVRLRRTQGETTFPARVQLVLAANPCPCARVDGDRGCTCSPLARRRYLGRLSGPLMDRIDLQVALGPITSRALLDELTRPASSAVVVERVRTARLAAQARWGPHGQTNAQVPEAVLQSDPFRLPAAVLRPIGQAVDRGQLSARGFSRVVRIAWSIADYDGRSRPDAGDVAEALDLRTGRVP